ncbi:MAG TPA: hypothetical protein VK530_13725, partial [Candidatus Acidoferrum sp.]|nr:hypothetical protein [Candidatus Acidoferrum sp.]
MPENIPAKALTDLIRKFGLELAFVEAGKDTGLLPLNCFLMQIEEALPTSSAPLVMVAATATARRWFDHVFDATALFDAPTIARLGEWHGWMENAAELWGNAQSLPEAPTEWNPPTPTSASEGLTNQPGEIIPLDT